MLMFQEAFNGRTCLGSWEPRKCAARTCRNGRMSFIRHETVTRDIACYLYRSNFSPPLPSHGATLGSETNCQDYLCETTEKRDIFIFSLEAS